MEKNNFVNFVSHVGSESLKNLINLIEKINNYISLSNNIDLENPSFHKNELSLVGEERELYFLKKVDEKILEVDIDKFASLTDIEDEFNLTNDEFYILLFTILKKGLLDKSTKLNNLSSSDGESESKKWLISWFEDHKKYFFDNQDRIKEDLTIGYTFKFVLRNIYNVFNKNHNSYDKIKNIILNEIPNLRIIYFSPSVSIVPMNYILNSIFLINYNAFDNAGYLEEKYEVIDKRIEKMKFYPKRVISLFNTNGDMLNLNNYEGDDFGIARYSASLFSTPKIDNNHLYWKDDNDDLLLIKNRKRYVYRMILNLDSHESDILMYFDSYEKLEKYIKKYLQDVSFSQENIDMDNKAWKEE